MNFSRFMQDEPRQEKTTEKTTEFIEGLDYYFDNGLLVMTAHYLRERGYCCSNDCRHCPYDKDKNS